ncbi:RNase P modulator RnpM [Anaerotalea alkaliphila]|uniref:YlxR family protein n=1 Tax=Anaerotalea alkaliphila TaxID=2662126 RepID=A0A7X5KM39_9FIRM|nr:YlxR family protein [Anaerotalea alkaliphila]NDL66318.1 YlxR family protein [Anaerotalea alkaliphila]
MQKRSPLRKCIGCGAMKDKREMVRVVRSPEGAFCVDRTGRKNGRGAYVCNDPACLERAVKSKGLERSFKSPIPKEVYEQLKKEFEEIG